MTSSRTQAVYRGSPTYSQTFPCEPSTASTGRMLVRGLLALWRLSDLADRAGLVVTELIANATRHTPCPEVRVIIRRPGAAWVRVGVVDREPSRLPTLGPTCDEDESGRGLLLIDAVADRWGYDLHRRGRHPWCKEVWAEIHVSGDE
ncbi:ATP-binding protein [Streptomyces sp. NPDC127068]|jgi:anti-sigma regulatory factor (Ser/Thr protein kinase)|uniref:ATP-binding protein n=1 Tax=Streptomyces sp. NPDC127068 TaxID=3347127 RepID=UPI00366A47FB